MKAGIFVVAELGEPVREQILEVQRWADPRLAAGTPPHVTMVGSSGVGPLPLGTPVELLREKVEPITRETPPITMKFERPHRFMQTDIIVLPLDPHGPLRVLHERVASTGLPFERARFQFSPHATLSFYPRMTPGDVEAATRAALRGRGGDHGAAVLLDAASAAEQAGAGFEVGGLSWMAKAVRYNPFATASSSF